MRHVLLATLALAACTGGGKLGDPPVDSSRPVDGPSIDALACALEPCSIVPQCGCVGVRACDVDIMDSKGTACRSILAPGKETATCTGLDRCDAGYVCLGANGMSSCKKYCSADADCGTPRGRCALEILNNGAPITDVPSACSSNCDPLPAAQPPDCPAAYKCGLSTVTKAGAPVKILSCMPSGGGTQGASCKQGTTGSEALCAPGYSCTSVDNGANFNCRRICNKTANTGCDDDDTCLGFNPPHLVGVEYGVCN